MTVCSCIHEVRQQRNENVKMSTSIVYKAKNGYLRDVIDLIQAGCPVNETDENNFTALYWSACHGYPDLCSILLRYGSHINTKFRCGFTSLHAAADRGQVDCVKILIECKADIDIQNDRGETALHLSCYRGFVDIVKILINTKADPFIKNNQNKTALQEALSQEFEDIGAILVRYHNDYSQLNYLRRDTFHRQSSNPLNRSLWPNSENNASNDLVLLTPKQFSQGAHSPIRRVVSAQPKLNIPVPENYANNWEGMRPEAMMTSKQNMFSYNQVSREPVESEIQTPMMYNSGLTQETMETFAEVLQIELAKSNEEKSELEKENEILKKHCASFEARTKNYDVKLKRADALLHDEREQRQQIIRRSHQHQSDLEKRVAEVELSSVNNSLKLSSDRKSDIKLCHKNILDLIKIRGKSTECFDWSTLCDKVTMLWQHVDNNQFLDVKNREWTLGCDFTLIGHVPLNHFADGQRDGSCSLVFRIQHKAKFYVLKMMINLINLYFVQHNDGHSIDNYLVDNFSPEYLVPLFLSGHPNIVQVLHYYQGSTASFKKYQSLLVPQNFDVPIEMANRTTFLVLPEYPRTLKSFMLEQKDNSYNPLFGLTELFLLQFFYQLLSSIVFLHTKKIVHRDIKADNIFLDYQLRPVLADFGFARRLHDHEGRPVWFEEKSQVAAGNSHAWAPELCRYSRCSPNQLPQMVLLEDIYGKSDGYAVARMMYNILQPPASQDIFPTSSVNLPNYENSKIPMLPAELSPRFRGVLRDLVLNDPLDRPTVKQAMFRIGAILFSPEQGEVTCREDMLKYHEARLLTLVSIESQEWRNRAERKKMVTIDESMKINSLEIEAHFLTSVSVQEIWDIYRHN